MKRFFAILFAVVCLFTLAGPTLAASSTVTVTAQVPEDWIDVHLYAWDDNTNNLAEWPGTRMERTGDGRFVLEIPTGYPYVIVNNGVGGTQTQDLSYNGTSDIWIVVDSAYGKTIVHYEDPGLYYDGLTPSPLSSMALVGEGNDDLRWDPSDPSCEMTLIGSGIYAKSLAMNKGETILFKFCGNDHWDGGYNFGGYDETDTFTTKVISEGTAISLFEGHRSTNLSYTATQDCNLTVRLDMNGVAPVAVVTENAFEEPSTTASENNADNSIPIWVILLIVGILVAIGAIVVAAICMNKKAK